MFRPTVLAIGLLLVSTSAAAADGYLQPGDLPGISSWLPPAPAPRSVREAADLDDYLASRPLVANARGAQAEGDNVYNPETVLPRFSAALGFDLTRTNAPALIGLMERVMRDQEAILAPVKRPVAEGGRVRPYVRFPSLPACPHERDDAQWHLAQSGSYPSGHAMLGWAWALLLSEAVPDRANEIVRTGYRFGESRLVCGFHFTSDLDAGRHAASALVARLHGDRRFKRDWQKALRQIRKARR